jgi:type IV pilus assembly protein PilO
MGLLPQDPRKQRMLMVAIVALGLSGIYHQYVAAPQGEAIDAAEAHVEAVELANGKAAAALRGGTVNKIKAEAASYRRDLDALRQLVPTGNEVPALLEQVSTAARRTGLDIASVEPMPMIVGEEFDTYRYKITVVGAYHPLGELLTNVGSLTRIIAPANLQLTPAPAAAATGRRAAAEALLKATFEIQTYVAKVGVPRPNEAARVAAAPATPESRS